MSASLRLIGARRIHSPPSRLYCARRSPLEASRAVKEAGMTPVIFAGSRPNWRPSDHGGVLSTSKRSLSRSVLRAPAGGFAGAIRRDNFQVVGSIRQRGGIPGIELCSRLSFNSFHRVRFRHENNGVNAIRRRYRRGRSKERIDSLFGRVPGRQFDRAGAPLWVTTHAGGIWRWPAVSGLQQWADSRRWWIGIALEYRVPEVRCRQ